MKTEIDLVREKQPFLTNISFLNKGKVKFQKNKTRHYKIKMLPKT